MQKSDRWKEGGASVGGAAVIGEREGGGDGDRGGEELESQVLRRREASSKVCEKYNGVSDTERHYFPDGRDEWHDRG